MYIFPISIVTNDEKNYQELTIKIKLGISIVLSLIHLSTVTMLQLLNVSSKHVFIYKITSTSLA